MAYIKKCDEYEWMDEQMDNLKAICPSNFEVGDIKNVLESMSLTPR